MALPVDALREISRSITSSIQLLQAKQAAISQLVAKLDARVDEADNNDAEEGVDTSQALTTAGNAPAEEAVPEILDKLTRAFADFQVASDKMATDHRNVICQQRQKIHRSAQAQATFTRFMDLPAELRTMIWKYAIPRRVYLEMQPGMNVRLTRALQRKPVILSHVCQESRDIVQRLCRLRDCDCVSHPLLGFACTCSRRQGWFDRQHCTLVVQFYCVGPWEIERSKAARELVLSTVYLGRGRGGLADEEHDSQVSEASQVIDHAPATTRWSPQHLMADIWNGVFNLNPTALKGKTISYMPLSCITIDRCWGKPELGRALFGLDEEYVLDLRDTAEVQRVADIMRSYTEDWTGIDLEFPKESKAATSRLLALAEGTKDLDWWSKDKTGIEARLKKRVHRELSKWTPTATIGQGLLPPEHDDRTRTLMEELNIQFRPVQVFRYDTSPQVTRRLLKIDRNASIV